MNREIVAFADDDSWWRHGSLAAAIGLFDQFPKLGLLMARVLTDTGTRIDPTCELMARSPLGQEPGLPGVSVLGLLGCGAIVRREAYLDAGGFDIRYRSGGEEELLALNLADRGWGLSYVNDLVAYHEPSRQREVKRRQSEGVANAIWTAWLKRRFGFALRVTGQQFAAAVRDPVTREGIWRALSSMPDVLRHRRPVRPEVERRMRLVEADRSPTNW